MYEDWLKLFNDHGSIDTKACPCCEERAIKFQFIGDNATRIGHLYVWCASCMQGIHASRVIIPEGVDFLPFGTSADELSKIIPNYKLIN